MTAQPDNSEPIKVVYTDEYGRELSDAEVKERLRDIHDHDYADWGGWTDDDDEF